VDHEEAFKSSCMAEGGRRVHDEGELHEEEDTAVELGSPASVAGASSCSVDARNQNGRGKTLLVHAQGDNIAQAMWAAATSGVRSPVRDRP
jgi:hypothetical protein